MVLGLFSSQSGTLADDALAVRGRVGQKIPTDYAGLSLSEVVGVEVYSPNEAFSNRHTTASLWLLREQTAFELQLPNASQLFLSATVVVGHNKQSLTAFFSEVAADKQKSIDLHCLSGRLAYLLNQQPPWPCMSVPEFNQWLLMLSNSLLLETGFALQLGSARICRGVVEQIDKTDVDTASNNVLPPAQSGRWNSLQSVLNVSGSWAAETPAAIDQRFGRRLGALLDETEIYLDQYAHTASSCDDALGCVRTFRALKLRQRALPNWRRARTEAQRQRWLEAIDAAANQSRLLQQLLRAPIGNDDPPWRDIRQALGSIDDALNSRQRVEL